MWSSRFWTPRFFDARHWAATGSDAVVADLSGVAVATGGYRMDATAGYRMKALAGYRMEIVGG